MRAHTTDNHGSTEQVFALCYLLGVAFKPRLADLGDVQLYRLDRTRSYGALDPLLRPADTAVIVEQWDHIVRIAASIRDRSSPAHVVVDRLAANASDRPAKALTMLGRVVRTAFIMRYLHDAKLRGRIQLQLNRGEGRHALTNRLFFGNDVALRTGEADELMNKVSALRRTLTPRSSVPMPMMRIGRVRMVVHQRHVSMTMTVGFTPRILGPVFMSVVVIVHVEVLVVERFVRVGMAVSLAQQKRDAEPHSEHRDHIDPAQCLTEQSERRESAHERSRGEERCLARRPDEPQRVRIEQDAEPVAQATDHECRRDSSTCRQSAASDPEADCRVRESCYERFHADDRKRIAQRQPLREVVVDRPASACRREQQDACTVRAESARLQLEYERAGENQRCRERAVATEVLAEREECEQHREWSLEIQQQRASEAGDALQAEQHQHGPGDSPRQHNARQLGEIAATQRRFGGPGRQCAMQPETRGCPKIQ